MKGLIASLLLLSIAPMATAEISTRVCLANGQSPFLPLEPNAPHVYPEIMVGTKLTVLVDSNVAEYWSGCLAITGTDIDRGVLSARDYNDDPNVLDWEGSRFAAASEDARVWGWEESGIDGFCLYGDSESTAGDWFIIDYNATNIGYCSVAYYDHNYDWFVPLYYLEFYHVRTRDFDSDTKVGFSDFSLLASSWQRTDCEPANWCGGTDLNTDGDVDRNDLMLFAEYWLETTEYNVRIRDLNRDAIVDFMDFSLLASHWAERKCRSPEWCAETDLDTNGNVDVHDLKLFADDWLGSGR